MDNHFLMTLINDFIAGSITCVLGVAVGCCTVHALFVARRLLYLKYHPELDPDNIDDALNPIKVYIEYKKIDTVGESLESLMQKPTYRRRIFFQNFLDDPTGKYKNTHYTLNLSLEPNEWTPRQMETLKEVLTNFDQNYYIAWKLAAIRGYFSKLDITKMDFNKQKILGLDTMPKHQQLEMKRFVYNYYFDHHNNNLDFYNQYYVPASLQYS